MDYIKSGFLVRRGASLSVARKGPIIAGLLLSTVMVGASFTDSTAMVIVILSVAFFGNGLASITWSLAPRRLFGLTGGMFNFIGNLSSIATPIVIARRRALRVTGRFRRSCPETGQEKSPLDPVTLHVWVMIIS